MSTSKGGRRAWSRSGVAGLRRRLAMGVLAALAAADPAAGQEAAPVAPPPAGAAAGSAPIQLGPVDVQGQRGTSPTATVGAPPPAYAGGQVATGGRLGVLGNRDVLDAPFTVQSYTADLARQQQARSVADLLANAPGVRLATSRTSDRDELLIRGFPVFASSGTSINGLFGLAPTRSGLEPYERVELIEGPSALLNGDPESNVGGSVNLVPKRATDEPILDATGSYLSDTVRGVSVDAGRRFGPDKAVGLRVNGALRDGSTPVDNNRDEFVLGSVAADYRGERLRASVDLIAQKDNTDAPSAIFLRVAPGFAIPHAPESRNNLEQPWGFVRSERTIAIGQAEYDLTRNVTAFLSFGRSNGHEDYLNSVGSIVSGDGGAILQPVSYPIYEETLTGEGGLRAAFTTFGVSHSLVAAYTGSRHELGARFTAVGEPIVTDLDSPTHVASRAFDMEKQTPKSSEILPSSYAISDTLGFLDDRVLLVLGARYQHIKTRDFDLDTGERTDGFSDNDVTPAVGLVVKPLRNLSLYASYIEALAPGPEAPAGTVNGGQVFEPTVSKQVEVGAKLDLGSFGVTAAVFQIKQPNGFTDPSSNEFDVDGEQRNRGVELQAFGEPLAGLRLLGGATLLDAELTKTAGGEFDGNDAPGVPDLQVNLGVDWDVPWARGLTVGGRVLYTSSQHYDQAETQQVPSWTRLDVGARYTLDVRGRPVTLRAGVENLLDADYWQSTSRGNITEGAPRTFLVSTSIRF